MEFYSILPPPTLVGFFESAVWATKLRLQSVIDKTILSFEEYATISTKVEAVLNSRIIAYKSIAEQGCKIITLAHFFIGQSLLTSPVLDSAPFSLSNRLQLLQNLLKGFWLMWSKDYLNNLQQHSKWCREQPNLAVGQIVLIRDNSTKPFEWPIGIVVDTLELPMFVFEVVFAAALFLPL